MKRCINGEVNMRPLQSFSTRPSGYIEYQLNTKLGSCIMSLMSVMTLNGCLLSTQK